MNGLHLVTGPMFASKSTELITQLTRHKLAGRRAWAFKPATDTRARGISSHDGLFIGANEITSDADAEALPILLDAATKRPHVLAFDEVQFMPLSLVGEIVALMGSYQIICAGLDLDAFGQPFEITMRLMALATTVEKRRAICMVEGCGNEACRTQRMQGTTPLTEGARVAVGGAESYEARCLDCFVAVTATRTLA